MFGKRGALRRKGPATGLLGKSVTLSGENFPFRPVPAMPVLIWFRNAEIKVGIRTVRLQVSDWKGKERSRLSECVGKDSQFFGLGKRGHWNV